MKQLIILPVLFLLMIAVPETVVAQKHGKVSGVVKDAKTGEKMYSATVYLKGTSIGSITDMDGKYSIASIPVGEYTLTVSYIGYDEYSKPITIEAGMEYKENINLQFSGGVDLEGVTITAQAEGQMKAINQQIHSHSIVSIASAEKIQELPDANAAEALGRLPGVALKRSGGEGNKVVIRGMSPKYNKVMINGMEMASSSGDRSTDLSMISPFALGEIEVIKSATAEQDADFVGGIVNFKLRTAQDDFYIDIIAEGSYNSLKNTYNDYNFVGNISNRFFDNRFGVFFQASTERRNRSANTANLNWGLNKKYNFELTPYNPYEQYSNSLSDVWRSKKRNGGVLVLDYKLPKGKIVFSNMINQGKTEKQTQVERYNIPSYQGSHDMYLSTRSGHYQTTTMTNILSYEQEISNFKLDVSLSHSSVNGDGRTISLETRNYFDTVADPSRMRTYFDYDPVSTRANGLTDESSISKQRQIEARANLEWLFSISPKVSGSIKAGGVYRSKEKSYDADLWAASMNEHSNMRPMLRGEFPEIGGEGNDFFLYDHLVDQAYTPDEFLKGDYQLGPRANIGLIDNMADYLKDVYNPLYPGAMNYVHNLPSSRINDYDGNEQLGAGYLLVNLNIGSKLTIIPGVRYEQNKTSYTGIFGNTHGYIVGSPYQIYDTTTIDRKNAYWLPNLQLKYNPLNWLQIHFGYTNTIARPNYDLLVPRREITGGANISQNEYLLRPEQATNFDLMFTFHQNHIGLISIGGFMKNIEDKIYGAPPRYMHDAGDYRLDSTKFSGYLISTQFNNENITYVKGLEIDVQTVFWFLPGAWKGLLINANYTYAHSSTKYKTTTVDKTIDPETWEVTITNIDSVFVDRLADQPTHIFNVSLGYDYKGFSARVSLNYTSDMFRGYSVYPEQRSYSDQQTRLDAIIRQHLPLGFQVYLSVSNITGIMETDLMGTATRWPINKEFYGTTATLGVRWTLQNNKK